MNIHLFMLTHLQWLAISHLLIIFWRKKYIVGYWWFSVLAQKGVLQQALH